MKSRLLGIGFDLVRLVFALGIAALAQHAASAAAFAERGRVAYGGEMFVFPAVLLLLAWLTGLIGKNAFSIALSEEDDEYID